MITVFRILGCLVLTLMHGEFLAMGLLSFAGGWGAWWCICIAFMIQGVLFVSLYSSRKISHKFRLFTCVSRIHPLVRFGVIACLDGALFQVATASV